MAPPKTEKMVEAARYFECQQLSINYDGAEYATALVLQVFVKD